MKVTIERAALLKAMSRAQSVVERKNTIPILANVLIEATGDKGGGQLSLRATDLDIEIIEAIQAVIEQPGAVTVSAHLLHEIVRKLPEGAPLAMSTDEATGRLGVVAGRGGVWARTRRRGDGRVVHARR